MGLVIDLNIGKTFGKTKIIGLAGTTKGYNKKYITQCQLCGYINKDGSTLGDIKRHAYKPYCRHNRPHTDYIGKKIGKYEIIGVTNKTNTKNETIYLCKCLDCGYICEHDLTVIRSSNINTKCIHSYWSNQRLHEIYNSMYKRCYTINSKAYKSYGSRGITICDEWLNHPWKFQEWALSNGYNDSLTIDRIDYNKGYYPENCRWVTLEENSKYKSTTKFISVNGILNSATGWDKTLNLKNGTINNYCNKNGYIKTAFYISNLLYPNLITPLIIIDENIYYNKIYY